jgi:hypothetical protein
MYNHNTSARINTKQSQVTSLTKFCEIQCSHSDEDSSHDLLGCVVV